LFPANIQIQRTPSRSKNAPLDDSKHQNESTVSHGINITSLNSNNSNMNGTLVPIKHTNQTLARIPSEIAENSIRLFANSL
jgi:hypothetical protein